MIKKILYMLCIIPFVSSISLNNSYCTSIMGNDLKIDFEKNNSANITATIFGVDLNCDHEKSSLENNNLFFSKNMSDCLNMNLKGFGACPCPPNVTYVNDSLIISNTPIGDINLNRC